MSATFCVFLAFIACICFLHLWYGLAEYIGKQEHEAFVAFRNWRQANPDYYIGEWPYAQQLVLDRIVAHEIWLAFHPYVKRNEAHIAWLIGLLTESPLPPSPRPRRKRPSNTQQPTGLFFLPKVQLVILSWIVA